MKNSILALLLIIVMFLSSCASGSNYVGRVNKNWIQMDEYMQHYRRNYEAFMLEHNFSPDMNQRKRLADEAWQRIVDGYTLKDLFEKHNITVTQREMIDTLRTNIPEIILSSPRFLDEDGKFDREKYNLSLVSDKPENLSWLRSYYLHTYIPLKKLEYLVLSQRKISNREIRDLFTLKNTEALIEVYSFDLDYYKEPNNPTMQFVNSFSNIPRVSIVEKDIEDYYNENRNTFFNLPRIDLNWVLFSNLPSAKDSLNTKIMADSIYNEIKSGKVFSNFARNFSAPPYNRLQGNAGFMDINEFDNDIKRKILSTSNNDLIKPFLKDNSWWIIRVDEKTQSMARLSIIKLDILASSETIAEARRKLDKFSELCYIVGFNRAAHELLLDIHRVTDLSLENNIVPTLGNLDNIIRRAMRLPDKTIFEPILINDRQTYIIFQVEKNTPGSFKSMLEVYDDIYKIIESRKQKERLEFIVNQFRGKFDVSQVPQDLIQTYNLKYYDKNFSYEFITECLSLRQNSLTGVYTRENNLFFARIISVNTDRSNQLTQYETEILRKELQFLNGNDYFNNWLDRQRKKSKVRDLRPSDLF